MQNSYWFTIFYSQRKTSSQFTPSHRKGLSCPPSTNVAVPTIISLWLLMNPVGKKNKIHRRTMALCRQQNHLPQNPAPGRKLILDGKDGCKHSLHQTRRAPPSAPHPAPASWVGTGWDMGRWSSRLPAPSLGCLGTWGHSLQLEGGGNRGWHHPSAPNGQWVQPLCALILGKWWGYSRVRGEQADTGVLIYKACPLKLTGLCKDLLHPALGRAIRAERDFATYVGRKQGVREAGEEPSVSR